MSQFQTPLPPLTFPRCEKKGNSLFLGRELFARRSSWKSKSPVKRAAFKFISPRFHRLAPLNSCVSSRLLHEFPCLSQTAIPFAWKWIQSWDCGVASNSNGSRTFIYSCVVHSENLQKLFDALWVDWSEFYVLSRGWIYSVSIIYSNLS